jgi:hypothetical protein
VAPELLRRDVHPAEVLLPDGRLLLDARVFVTDRRLLVWKAGDAGVRQVLEMPLAAEAPAASRQSLNGGNLELVVREVAQAGKGTLSRQATVLVNQGHGCGCGSPLKALAAPVSWTAA